MKLALLLLLGLLLCSTQADRVMKVLIIKHTPSSTATLGHVKQVLDGPGIPYVEEEYNCATSDCAADFKTRHSTTTQGYAGIVLVEPVIYQSQFLHEAIHEYAQLHGIRVVLPYTNPRADNKFNSNSNFAYAFLFDKSVRDASPPNAPVEVFSGPMQGVPCSNSATGSCVPGELSTKTLEIALEAQGLVCGNFAGSSGLQCDIKIPSQAVWHQTVTFKPGNSWQCTNCEFMPVITYVDDGLDYIDATTGTWSGTKPPTVVAAVVKDTYFGKMYEELQFFCAQGDWPSQSKLLGYVWLHYLLSNVYVGHRRVYLTPQIDDFLFSTKFRDELPNVFMEKGTFPPGWSQEKGAKKWPYRDSPEDVNDLIRWQRGFRKVLPPGSDFTIEMAFNGQGTPVRAWESMHTDYLTKIATTTGVAGRKNPFHPDNYIFDNLWFYLTKGTTKDESHVPTLPLLEFFWVSHTWSHLSLTCVDFPDIIFEGYPVDPATSGYGGPYYYNNRRDVVDPSNPNSGSSLQYPTSKAQVRGELSKNKDFFARLMSIVDGQQNREVFASFNALVPPKISGMYNKNSLEVQLEQGITSVVGDNTRDGLGWSVKTVRPEWAPKWCINNPDDPTIDVTAIYNNPDIVTPTFPWHGRWTTLEWNNFAGQFIIPRWATEIYFDASTLEEDVFMYNEVVYGRFGPDALSPNELLQREADRVVGNLINLRHDAYMFHQANLRFFYYDQVSDPNLPNLLVPINKQGINWINSGGDTPFTCLTCVWCERIFTEFSKRLVFPLATLRQDNLAISFHQRMDMDQKCDVTAVAATTPITLATGEIVQMMTQVAFTANQKGTAGSATCIVPFTGSEASMAQAKARPDRFPQTELDPFTLNPVRRGGNSALYRTVFGPERSFYVKMQNNGDQETVQLATPRAMNVPNSYAHDILVTDVNGNPFSLANTYTGAITIKVKSTDATKRALVTFSSQLGDGWTLTGTGVPAGQSYVDIPAGTTQDFQLSRTGNAGKFVVRVSFSCAHHLYDMAFIHDQQNDLIDITPPKGVNPTNLGSIKSHLSKSFDFKYASKAGKKNPIKTIEFSHELLPEQQTALSVSIVGGKLRVTLTGTLTGAFSTSIVAQGTLNDGFIFYEKMPITWTVLPPYTPLEFKNELRVPLVDVGFTPLGTVATAKFGVRNTDLTNSVSVQVNFGGQAVYGPSAQQARRKRDVAEELDFEICISEEPVWSVEPTIATIAPGTIFEFTVKFDATPDIRLECGSQFSAALSVWQETNPDQPNLIMDVIGGITPAATQVITSTTTSTAETTSGSTVAHYWSLSVTDQGASVLSCDAVGGTVTGSILIYEVDDSGSLVLVGSCTSAKKRQGKNVALQSSREYRVKADVVAGSPTTSSTQTTTVEVITDQGPVVLKAVTEVKEPANICSVFVDSATDGVEATTVGGSYELLGLGVCDDCNKIRLVVAGNFDLNTGQTFRKTVIGPGDTIFSFWESCPPWDVGPMSESFKICRGADVTLNYGESAFFEFSHDTSAADNTGVKMRGSLEIKRLPLGADGQAEYFEITRTDRTLSFCGKGCITGYAWTTDRQSEWGTPEVVQFDVYAYAPATSNGKYLGYSDKPFCIAQENRCGGGSVNDQCMLPMSKEIVRIPYKTLADSNKTPLKISCPVLKWQTCEGSYEISGCPTPPIREEGSNIMGVHWFTGAGGDSGVTDVGVYANTDPMSVQSSNWGFQNFKDYLQRVLAAGGTMGLFTNPDMSHSSYFPDITGKSFTTWSTIRQGTLLSGYPVSDVTVNWPDITKLDSKFPAWAPGTYRVFEFDRRAFPPGNLEYMATQSLECANDIEGVRGQLQSICTQPPPQCQAACCRVITSVVLVGLCAGSGGESCLYSLPNLKDVSEFKLESAPGGVHFAAGAISSVTAHPRDGRLFLFERAIAPGKPIAFRFYILDLASDPIPAPLEVQTNVEPIESAELLDAAFDPCDLRVWVSVRSVGLFSFDPTRPDQPANFERNHVDETPEFRWEAIAFAREGRRLIGFQDNSEYIPPEGETNPGNKLFTIDLKATPVQEVESCTDTVLPSSVRAMQFSNTENDILHAWALTPTQSSKDIVTVWRVEGLGATGCSAVEWKVINDGENSITGVASITPVAPCQAECKPVVVECEPDEYFDDATTSCQPCSDKCLRCEKAPEQCTECPRSCYLDGTTCTYCPSPCTECSAPDTCTACLAGHALEGQKCVPCDKSCKACAVDSSTTCTACPAGTYLENGKCEPCSQNCLRCEGDPDYCTECFVDWNLVQDGQQQFCVKDCPVGTERLLVSNIGLQCVCTEAGKVFDKKTQQCQPFKSFQVCAGIRFATLDGSAPGSKDYAGQTEALPLPSRNVGGKSTWTLVPPDIKYRECLSCYDWGTECLVFEGGKAYQASGEPCGEGMLVEEAGPTYKPLHSSFRIVIMQRFDSQNSLWKPPLLGSGGWEDYKGGYQFLPDPTDATNHEGIVSCQPDDSQEAGATWRIQRLPPSLAKGFDVCAESMLVYDDNAVQDAAETIAIPNRSLHRYSINVDIFYSDGTAVTPDTYQFSTGNDAGAQNQQQVAGVCPEFGFYAAFPKIVRKKSAISAADWSRRCVSVRPANPDKVVGIYITLLFDPCDSSARNYQNFNPYADCKGTHLVQALFRNVQLTELDENLLGNSGFEETDYEETGFGGGVWYKYASTSFVSIDATMAHSGAKSVHINYEGLAPGEREAGMQQIFFFDDPTRHTQTVPGCIVYANGNNRPKWPRSFHVSGWSKASNVDGESSNTYSIYVDFRLKNRNSNQWSYGHFLPFSTGTHEWEFVEGILYAPEEVAAVYVTLLFKDHTGEVWFDDIRVTPRDHDECTWTPPDTGDCYGDPHLLTHDLLPYDMMTAGEYTLTTGGSIEVQVRNKEAPPAASITSGVAVLHGGKKRLSVVAVDNTDTTGDFQELWPVVTIFGDKTETRKRMGPNENFVHSFGNSVYIAQVKSSADKRSFTFVDRPSDITVTIEVRRTELTQYMRVFVKFPESLKGKVKGLLGNWDGNTANDFVTRDGKAMDVTATLANQNQLNRVFIDSWRINDATSGFAYPPGKTSASYYNAAWPPKAFSLADYTQAQQDNAKAQCAKQNLNTVLNDACIIDVLTLGSNSVVTEYAAIQKTNINLPSGINVGCKSSCKSCQPGDGTKCLTCHTGNFLLNGDCVSNCGAGLFADSRDGKCNPCSGDCVTCVGTSTNCLSCKAPKMMIAAGGACVDKCPIGQAVRTKNNIKVCTFCINNCRTCQDETLGCTSCYLPGYTLYRQSCLPDCPAGEYKDMVLFADGYDGFQCQACSEGDIGFRPECTVICPAGQVPFANLPSCFTPSAPAPAGGNTDQTIATTATLVYLSPYNLLSFPDYPEQLQGVVEATLTLTIEITGKDAAAFVRLARVGDVVVPDMQPFIAYSNIPITITITVQAPESSSLLPQPVLLIEWITGTPANQRKYKYRHYWELAHSAIAGPNSNFQVDMGGHQ